MDIVITALVSFVLGELFGIVFACLCVASGRSDDHMEELEQEEEENTDGSSL